ncbi:hypothetical protein Halha_1684 [Halobacteroides halobius DSM 5150]|uniref:Uncharacterized protein n=1 Tax=Halobacteroides halobius (strain ATCC 35273 / DSM 5150 / MD-1) TaxID=748449 RepID=L0K9C8_HALHC|nr:hypothetical protein [Halobacteroides halobius]AGB41621.1 hypothetical protein Halha_1684 [Halobacteroides halobius DSM 5150]
MSYLEEINEEETDGFCFQIKHKSLKLPRETYLNSLSQYSNPFSEKAVQHLVEDYLDWKNEQGVLGMVRIDDNSDTVKIDAAVRYLTDCRYNKKQP